MIYSILLSIFCSSAWYLRACSVVFMGGIRLGYSNVNGGPKFGELNDRDHDIGKSETSLMDMGSDQRADWTLPEMDMEVCRR